MTGTSSRQDQRFAEVLGKQKKLEDFLEELDFTPILDIVAEEFSPEEVFATNQLEEWAERNGYTRE